MAFIGIDRAIENHWIYQDPEYFKVWFEILIRARFGKDTERKLIEGELVTIEYGYFVFGRIKWSERLKVSERRIRTLFDKLLKDGMIELVMKHRKCTVYNVVNYAKYHVKNDQQNDQQPDQPQQGNTGFSDQHNDHPATSERPAGDQRATTQEQSKQRNKDNKVNKEIKEYPENTVELTNHLIDLMTLNNPNVKIPASLDKWNDEMEKLERLDKYDYMQIRSVIDWCQQDSFWKSNILSAPKFREKMGTMLLQMQRPKAGPSGNGKLTGFAKLQQMAKEEDLREASGHN